MLETTVVRGGRLPSALEGPRSSAVERLRRIDDVPVALHRVCLPFSLAPELARRSIDGPSLYAALEHDLGIRLTTAHQRITAVAATNARPVSWVSLRARRWIFKERSRATLITGRWNPPSLSQAI